MKQFVKRTALSGFAARVIAAVCIAATSPTLALGQVPPPPGPAGPVPPPPPPAAPLPTTGAAASDILQGVNPDVQAAPGAEAAPSSSPAIVNGESGTGERTEGNETRAAAAATPATGAALGQEDAASDSDGDEESDEERAFKASMRSVAREQEERLKLLKASPSLRGSTGLFRLHSASSGPVGTFRFGLLTSYMSSTGFLVPSMRSSGRRRPSAGRRNEPRRGHVQVGATVLPFLEAYLGIHSTATRNSLGKPVLLQTFADTTWGSEGFYAVHAGSSVHCWRRCRALDVERSRWRWH